MATWSNWSGRQASAPAEIRSVADEAAVSLAVRDAARRGLRVRALGAGHSHAPLVTTDGLILDTAPLDGVVSVDAERCSARIRAGTRISALGVPLRDAGCALRNQGDIDRQALAGAIATGTHGTGVSLQNLSASLLAARLVLASGDVVECSLEREPDLFQVARLSLGAVGVATELEIAVRDAYRLEETMWLDPLDAVLDRIDELTRASRHFEFFWMPGRRRCACKALTETFAEPRRPTGPEGSRLSWSYEVLANDRPDKHTEMEYSVPATEGPGCLRALRELVTRDFEDLAWPIEYRTLKADATWLSSAYGRETVTISVHQGIDADDRRLFRACEEVFLSHAGRPHWGKVHYLEGDALAARYPRYLDWWRVRDRFDPEGRFLNAYLERLRPGA